MSFSSMVPLYYTSLSLDGVKANGSNNIKHAVSTLAINVAIFSFC